MRSLAKVLWVLAVLLPFLGCHEVTTDRPYTLVASTAGAGDSSPELPLAGLELCETDTTNNCVFTDDSGEATLWFPVGQEYSVTLTKEGDYAPYLIPYVMKPGGVTERIFMGTEQHLVEQFQRIGSAWPMRDTGAVIVGPIGLPGVTLKLFGATGIPFYVDAERHWTTDLTATTSGGAGYVEVGPGDFRIDLGGTARGCTPVTGWSADRENSIRFPVREGYLTLARMRCPPPP